MASIMEGVDRLTRIAGQNRLELLLFKLGSDQLFGINVFKVREVLKCPPLRSVPHSHANVRGVVHARGQTITIIDLGKALGAGESKAGEGEYVIVTEYNGLVQGYLVERVERICNLRWDEIKPPPAGIGNENYLTAVVTIDDKLVEILDVEKVLSEIMEFKIDVSDALIDIDTPTQRPRHIFFADDSAVARKQIARVLDQLEITYEFAKDGAQAFTRLLEIAEESDRPITDTFGMVLSDIEMPQMDGYTLTKAIKAEPLLKSLYVCLHTSLSGNFNQAMVQTVGADRLVAKFDPDELARTILAFLNGEPLEDEDTPQDAVA